MLTLLCDFGSAVKSVGGVILAFVVLMFMVLVHEAGHYAAGRILKFQINEFSVGMGPKLLQKTRKDGQKFTLRLLPLGGYCAFEGEDEDNNNPRAFNAQAPWKRLIVLFSGAFCNFISALLICVILFSCYGETVAKVNYVFDYAPAYTQSSLQSGDILYEINGKQVFVLDDIGRYMDDDTLDVVVIRNGEKVEIKGLSKSTFTNNYVATIKGDIYTTSSEQSVVPGGVIYRVNNHIMEAGQNVVAYLNAPGKDNKIVISTHAGCYLFIIETDEFIDNIKLGDNNGVVYVESVNKTYSSNTRVLIVGDSVVKVNGVILQNGDNLSDALVKDADNVLSVIDNQGKYHDYKLTYDQIQQSLTFSTEQYKGLGISVAYDNYKFSFGKSLARTFPYCGEVAMLVLRTLGGLFTGLVGFDQIGGPITTISMTSQIVSTFNMQSILTLIVLISVNLGVFNLLPVPSLDGCRMVFVIIEWIRGKPVNRKIEGIVNGLGLILLIGFMIIVDLLKL